MAPGLPASLTGTAITLCALSLLTTALRCYVRLRVIKAWGPDDTFMVLACACFAWFSGTILTGIHYGTGRRTADITVEDAVHAMHCWYFCFLAYATTITFAKVSAGFFFLRIAGVMQIHRIATWIVTMLAALVGFIFFFVTAFQCAPIQFFWTRLQESSGTCISMDVIIGVTYLYGAVSLFTDVAYAGLLCMLVWNLQIDRRTKMLLAPLLALTCIGSYGAAIRMPYIKLFKDPDFLYSTITITLWSIVEAGISVIAANLATLRPLIDHIAKTSRSLYTRSSGYSGEHRLNSICDHHELNMSQDGIHGKPHVITDLCVADGNDVKKDVESTASLAGSWRRDS